MRHRKRSLAAQTKLDGLMEEVGRPQKEAVAATKSGVATPVNSFDAATYAGGIEDSLKQIAGAEEAMAGGVQVHPEFLKTLKANLIQSLQTVQAPKTP